MFTNIQYRLLQRIGRKRRGCCSENAYESKSKLQLLLGEEFLDLIRGKTVIDFGCGQGLEAIEMARAGAKRVIGIDIREDILQSAKQRAIAAGLQDACTFASRTDEQADLIVSVDSFEHFEDPAAMLHIMSTLVSPGGEVVASFGPTWYHPLGGHFFSVFPWAHLIFSEKALIRWRSTFKNDGATKFSEVAGGLNQMTISRFEKLVEHEPFSVTALELVPIRQFRGFHNRLTREFTTAIVRCRLVRT